MMLVFSGKYVLCRNVEKVKHLSGVSGLGRKFNRFCYNGKSKVKKKEITSEKMGLIYNPKETESKWYDWWEAQGYFKPKDDGKIFTVLLPPPNVTGTLHLGHALNITIQDIYLRWMRMKGENVLWIAGFDHAGIAAQVIVEKYLENKLNITKYDIGKTEFLKRISQWGNERENLMIEQMRRLGASTDWSKKFFTMDNKHIEAVTSAFLHLYNKGLIYRCTSLINWSCYMRSAVSDIEIEWRDVRKPTKISVPGYEKPVLFGYMYNIAYRIWPDNGDGEEIVVSTTRPETILGDTAIAIHPNDTRYSHLRGKFVWHPLRKCKIPIIFDETVKPEMGTGVVKVTPSHSVTDYEIFQKHNIEVMDVFDETGLIRKIDSYSNFGGKKLFDAREEILNELQNLGLYRGKNPHAMMVPICPRSRDIIEHLMKPQWFLKCSEMYEKVEQAISKGEVTIEPEHCIRILFEWFKYSKDWNLSRQIWWGHQIPMYECEVGEEKDWIGATSEEEAKLMMSNKLKVSPKDVKVTRDPDVLDTWFSSGILPFAACGWPKQLFTSYPLGMMDTGCDIVFYWVARMLMLGLEITGQVPFPKVILHGLICDGFGKKMSKSKGNVILPEYVINGVSLEKMKDDLKENHSAGILSADELKYAIEGQSKMFPCGILECGADALRMGLCSSIIKADQINFDIKTVRAHFVFCNKIWQSVVYLLRSVKNLANLTAEISEDNLSVMDKWILSRLSSAVESVNGGISDFQYHSAIEDIKLFFHNEFCSTYLENTKLVLKTDSEEDSRRTIAILFNCLETSLRLLSPFMPFVTEELYHCLPELEGFTRSESITLAEFPDPNNWKRFNNPEINELVSSCLGIIRSIRALKTFYKLSSQKLKVIVVCPSGLNEIFNDDLTRYVKTNAGLEKFSPAIGAISELNAIVKKVGVYTFYLYHEHTKNSLREIVKSVIREEEELRKCLDTLKLSMSEPDYASVTPMKVQNKNYALLKTLNEKLTKIEEIKNVIDRAQ